MRNPNHRSSKYVLGLFVGILALSLIHWTGGSSFLRPGVVEAKVTLDEILSDNEHVIFDRADPGIQRAMDVQERNTHVLMAEPGIVGAATGVTKEGRPAIIVLAKSFQLAKAAVIPGQIEDVPVIVRITGEIKPLKPPAGKGPGNGKSEENVDPTAWFDRPVPIGVSTGHPNITAGTIGCRVTDGTDVYALSNNHIFADENQASVGDNILQPGPFDGGVDPDRIGTLFDFAPISFDGSDNTIDAAIALSSTYDLGSATPSDGYGMPKSTPGDAAINQPVMKYGRTTGQTKGKVWAINATVDVTYDSGVARFVHQIIITPGNFSAGGDSGSLVVVQKGKDARKPVGLLFARSQVISVANPINAVLEALGDGFTIDGE